VDAVHGEGAYLARLVVVPDHVETPAPVPDAVRVEVAHVGLAGATRGVLDAHAAALEHRFVEGADGLARLRVALVRAGQHAEGALEAREEARQLGPEAGADLGQRGMDRVVEHGAGEALEQVLAEGEGHQLVRGEGRLAQLERVEQPVEDAALALLAGDRKAGELEGVEVAVDRAPMALELCGEVVEAGAVAAAREELDQPPLPCELIASHRDLARPTSRPAPRTRRCACPRGSSRLPSRTGAPAPRRPSRSWRAWSSRKRCRP
jgi:hypothetical protein